MIDLNNKNRFAPGIMLLADIEEDYEIIGKTHEHDGGAQGTGGNISTNPQTQSVDANFRINDSQ